MLFFPYKVMSFKVCVLQLQVLLRILLLMALVVLFMLVMSYSVFPAMSRDDLWTDISPVVN